jgi:Mg/Co/Ni transporter MgtE
LHTAIFKDSTSSDSLKSIQNGTKSGQILLSDNKTQDSTHIQNDYIRTKPDSSYLIWMKQTAKLYESMDPKKAAKIIQSYSDNIARDIIYSMKQKNAAEILSELNPDTANRITRAKSNAF